ncbi:hypothetical protein J3E69DRAFT_72362 [Trichoderma sp. SZMC 28015]
MPVSCHFHFFFSLCSATLQTVSLLLRRRFSLGGKRAGAGHARLGNRQRECLSSVRVLFAFSIAIGASQAFCVLMGNPSKTLFHSPSTPGRSNNYNYNYPSLPGFWDVLLGFFFLFFFTSPPTSRTCPPQKRLSLSTDIQPNPV